MTQQVLRKVTGNRLILLYIALVATLTSALLVKEALR